MVQPWCTERQQYRRMHQATRPAPPLYWRPIAGDLHQAATLARPSCRRQPSPPSRTAPGMHHVPTDAGRIAARRAPGRSMPTCAGLPIRTSARPGTTPPDRPVMRLANGAWPSSPRQAACRATPCPAEPRQRLAPLAFSPLPPPALPPRHRFATAPLMAYPAIRGLRLAAGYHVPAWAARAPANARSKASQGASKLHNENYPQPVGCPARARIIFVMQNAGPLLRAPARPGCRAAPARTALLVSGSPACHPSAPEGGSPKVGAGATAICG